MGRKSGETSTGPVIQALDETHVLYQGKSLLYFGGCDYFRLSFHPAIKAAVKEGVDEFGLNVSASRVTTGNHPLYERLEAALARFFGAEAALLTATGYAANMIAAQGLGDRFAHGLIDKKTHPSMQDALGFLKFKTQSFGHCDTRDFQRRMRNRESVLLMTDAMFPQGGVWAPLKEYLGIMRRRDWVLLDEAHSAGVLGNTGRGLLEELRKDDTSVIRTMTLSKAFGLFGGAVLGPNNLIERMRRESRAFAGSTPLPLPIAAAAIVSLDLVNRDTKMRAALRSNTKEAKEKLQRSGWKIPDNHSPIIGITPSTSGVSKRLRTALMEGGIYPSFIRYPGGPTGGCFRFAISSAHTTGQIRKLTDILTEHTPSQRDSKTR